MLDLQIT